jgi:hypothetical protein
MGTPKYARFRRADLQMQTPLDRRHWVGASLDNGGAGLPPKGKATEEQIRLSAQRYAARCQEVGLEIIGLTDHNLGGPVDEVQSFVEELRRQLADDATVFLGFEVAAKVGRGAHFLCLFDASMSARDVSDVLTELGLAEHDRFARGEPAPVDRNWDQLCATVQDKRKGIIVAAHAVGTSGLCSDDTVAEWWGQDLIADVRLQCIELPKARTYYADRKRQQTGSLILRGEDGWGGGRYPVAMINSSDCKRLGSDDRREDTVNQDESWVGKRWTWIKTGPVTIEALRQAFLDHESRIETVSDWTDLERLPPGLRPGRRRITRLQVRGANFLADQEIHFSPELNTIIGGGGTGKSTLLGYLGEALRAEPPTTGVEEKLFRPTLGPGEAVVDLQAGSESLVLRLTAGGSGVVEPPEASDLDLGARFPIRYVRQREAFAIANKPDARRALVDELITDRLAVLRRREAQVQARLTALDGERASFDRETAELRQVDGEIARLKEDVSRLRGAAAPMALREQLRKEDVAIRMIDERLDGLIGCVRELQDDLTLDVSLSDVVVGDTPNAAAITELRARVAAAVDRMRGALGKAAEDASDWAAEERARPEREDWARALAKAEADFARLAADLPESSSLAAQQAQLAERETEHQRLQRSIATRSERIGGEEKLLAELRAVWAEETAERRRVASVLRDVVPEAAAGIPYVTVEIEPFGDVEALCDELRRTLNNRNRFGQVEVEALTTILRTTRAADEHPLDTLCRLLDENPDPDPFAAWTGPKRAALEEACDDRPRLRRWRVPDRVTVALNRKGGAPAGTLDDGLSVGQKCIAVLTLLLAMGDDPILIDQPEDEIDNEFIYTELVRLIAHAKERRQVILVTHNANIPVNGDAELIYALEARREGGDKGDARGYLKKLRLAGPGGAVDHEAQGPLEVQAVREAVSEIMEGSKEAFERRRAKYGLA